METKLIDIHVEKRFNELREETKQLIESMKRFEEKAMEQYRNLPLECEGSFPSIFSKK